MLQLFRPDKSLTGFDVPHNFFAPWYFLTVDVFLIVSNILCWEQTADNKKVQCHNVSWIFMTLNLQIKVILGAIQVYSK